jgi:outer membrane murein-binding lipoprotein Lpp
MGSRRRRPLTLLVVVLAGALVAGCGGDDDSDDATSANTTINAHDDAADTTDTTASDEDECRVEGAAEESPATPAATTVQVALGDYTVVPQPDAVPAGTVELAAANGSTLVRHELEVVRFDGDPATLPRNFVGGADESQLPDGAVVGKIRVFDPGQTCRATFDLAPGAYVLLCNLVDDGSTPHYGAGMFTRFTVT